VAGQKIETVVDVGEVARLILDFAETEDIDLIVMATHGHTGLRRWVYGSVTEKVLRGSRCALLVVRPPAHELTDH
ncbi:MAG TPA: universal stress protein, partial [Anaerolineae bacterium]